MKNAEQLKNEVREKYGEIATKSSSCGCCSPEEESSNSDQSDNYRLLDGYNPDADLKLGCGIPTEFAQISKGDTVVDLGSGAGNDCFVARALAGDAGRVIGIDFTGSMIEKARKNASRTGFANVEFILGDIENIPLDSETADVVVSNCVMNLVPDKLKAFKETFRILKKGGHFSISDIVTKGDLPEQLRDSAALYAGCVSGAIDKDRYLEIIREAGFANIAVQRQKPSNVPEQVFVDQIGKEATRRLLESGAGIFSVTIYGEKN